MLHLFLYFLFVLIYYFIKIVPNKYLIGKGVGILIYKLLKDRKEVTINNLKSALGERLKYKEIISLSKETYRQMGLTMVEFMQLEDLSKDDIGSKISTEGLDYLEKAFSSGKGVILYSAHFGNWEWLPSIVSLLGYPVNAIARIQDNPYFDRKINEIRKSKGVNIIAKGMSIRKAFKVLKKGELLYILGDQNARDSGWQLDFFSQSTSIFPGTVQLASRTGALILPVYLIREKWGKYHLKIYPPYEIGLGADTKKQEETLIELSKNMESLIAKYPEQWLWMHRIWKK